MSTTRRVFLRSAGLGVFAWPFCGMSARSVARGAADPVQFDRVFYDARRSEALRFGDTARRLGARTLAISGAVEEPWFEELRRRWQTATAPVAGMTDFRALFLLQTMASDAGLRLVLRVNHYEHLSHAGRQCGETAARLVMNFAGVDRTLLHRAAETRAANLSALDSRVLVTWVIA